MSQSPQQPVPHSICFAHSLPNEILADILSYLAPRPATSVLKTEYAECLSIPLVCHRWRRLYDTVLYRKIDLGLEAWEGTPRPRRLFRTLTERPDLRDHVRVIHVNLLTPYHATCRVIADIIQYCNSVRKLGLHINLDPGDFVTLAAFLPLRNAAKGLSRLEKLQFSGKQYSSPLRDIMNYFDLPTLRKMEIDGYGLDPRVDPHSPGTEVPWNEIDYTPHQEVEEFFAARQYSSGLTILKLRYPRVSPSITQRFLEWPAQLESLSLTQLFPSNYRHLYTTQAVQLILNSQIKSLQHIVLGTVPTKVPNSRQKTAIPDFSQFQQLRTLQLSGINLLAVHPRLPRS
ncbi:hypothetical protein MMC12_007835 [Toensbergia leucococca]|nr:hypothetical protein [Toensbergia leucococca]